MCLQVVDLGKPERERPKRTMSASGGSGALQMVSEPYIGQCANLLAVPRRWVDTRRCVRMDAGPQRGRFGGDPTSIGGRKECQRGCWAPKGVDCDVSHGLGRRTNYHL